MSINSIVTSQRHIGLALSGGGVRAAAFHAGVLKWLAERELLEKIEHISSVSGGTLFVGLVFHASDYCWPTSEQYLKETLPYIQNLLTGKSLQTNAILRLLCPLNWHFLLSRANVVSQSIENYWGIAALLEQLPQQPVWSINATTAENGRRFRFKGLKMGDYETGYADAENFKLADAMAVSAAFPGGIGPLALDSTKHQWWKRKSWDLSDQAEVVIPLFKKLHLYDGGVYDNLGLEPLFDVGTQTIKSDTKLPINFLIVSDAGAPYKRCVIPRPLSLSRLKRVADAAFDQVRALRVRSFVNYLKRNSAYGMYLQIGSDPQTSFNRFCKSNEASNSGKSYSWMCQKDVSSAVSYKTTLAKMSFEDFDLLVRHGYETALWNDLALL